MTPLLTWDIKPEAPSGQTPADDAEVRDGVKLIQAVFRDYGNNIISANSEKFFRTYKNLDNRNVSTILYNGTYLYSTFDRGSGNFAELYRNLTFISTLEGDATALEYYNGILYISIKDDENKGILQRYTVSVDTIADNYQAYLDSGETVVNSLYSADSVINTMEVFDGALFLGLDNGELLNFRGSLVESKNSTYKNVKSINHIKTDGILLYIFFKNTTEMLIMNKNSAGEYVFNMVDTEN